MVSVINDVDASSKLRVQDWTVYWCRRTFNIWFKELCRPLTKELGNAWTREMCWRSSYLFIYLYKAYAHCYITWMSRTAMHMWKESWTVWKLRYTLLVEFDTFLHMIFTLMGEIFVTNDHRHMLKLLQWRCRCIILRGHRFPKWEARQSCTNWVIFKLQL